MTGSIERNMSPWWSRSKGTLCALAVLVSLAASCQEDRPEPTDPEGAYRLFMEAIEAKDEDAVWEYLDQGTKDLFAEQYKALVRIDRIIEAYFDPSEHRYMRERTGAYLLETEHIDSAKRSTSSSSTSMTSSSRKITRSAPPSTNSTTRTKKRPSR